MSLNITKDNTNKIDLADPRNQELWIEDQPEPINFHVINSSRIGLGKSAEECVNKLLRFYIFKNSSVSKKDKEAEKCLKVEVLEK